jgi:hypothetical protein
MPRPSKLLDIPRTSALLAALLLIVYAVPASSQTRYSYSSDGSEVNDSQTGLIWRRCAEGMVWVAGTCSGSPFVFTHEAALTQAQIQVGWRLPNIKELSSLAAFQRGSSGINSVAFPANPDGSYWSSTPYTPASFSAWAVNFGGGSIRNAPRTTSGPIRLVR